MNPILAEFELGELMLSFLAIFFLVIWLWILIYILMDLFRDHKLSGWWKAVWVLFLIFIPFLTALVYLIARGHGMQERSAAAQIEAKQQFDSYVRDAAATSPADELTKLNELKKSGGISEADYEKLKAKIVS